MPEEPRGESFSRSERGPRGPRRRRSGGILWERVGPLFLSGLLFISGFLTVFAPLPLLLLFFTAGPVWLALGAVSNLAVVYLIAGPLSLSLYVVFGISVALGLPMHLKRGRSLGSAGLRVLGGMLAAGVSLLLVHSTLHGVSPWSELISVVGSTVDQTVNSLTPEARTSLLEGMEYEEWRRVFLVERLPNGTAIFALIVVWANLSVLLAMNPARLREKLGVKVNPFREFKAPEWMVWPVIVCGATLLLGSGLSHDVAWNLLWVLMAIYVIQGLSILSFLLDVWKVRGLFRVLVFVGALYAMIPLILGVGFFDLWFDFRAKFRQS